MKVHSEIEYEKKDGTGIHSDTCPKGCLFKNVTNKKWRKFIHDVLDEWLDESNGTGIFYIKQEGYNHFEDQWYTDHLKKLLAKRLEGSCTCGNNSDGHLNHELDCVYREIKDALNDLS